jgi:hypothetical protein
MPQHAHDGVKLGAPLCELRADGMTKAMGTDCRAAGFVEQACVAAGDGQRLLKEVCARQQSPVAHEDVPRWRAGEFIIECAFCCGLALRNQVLQCVFCLTMQRDHALPIRLAWRQPKARGRVRILVQRVERDALDLALASAGPPGDEQGRPLVGALKPRDSHHEPFEFVRRDESAVRAWASGGSLPGPTARDQERCPIPMPRCSERTGRSPRCAPCVPAHPAAAQCEDLAVA